MLNSFKKLVPVGATCLALLAAAFLNSCSDDDATQDTISPEASITSLDNNATVWNTVSLSVTASDNDGVDSVKLYIDGTLNSSITQTPYDFSWNSNTVSDGTHTVKVVVVDKAGNKTVKEISITVSNVLVSLTIPSTQLQTDEGVERGFIFLSDENGKVIASTEYENGKSYTLKSSDFNGNKFYLTEVYVRTTSEGSRSRLWTWTQIERGKNWVFIRSTHPETTPYVGDASITYTNALDNGYYNFVSNGGSIMPSASPATIKLGKNPSKLLVIRREYDDSTEPKYGLYSNIQVGANTINLKQVSTTSTKATLTVPEGATTTHLDIYGLAVSDSYDEIYNLPAGNSTKGTTMSYYYPGSAFPMYYRYFYYETDGVYYQKASNETSFSIAQISNEVAVSFADSKLTYSASGDFDFFTLSYDTESSSWYYILPKGASQTLPTLEIPGILSSYSFPAMAATNSYSVYDMGELSSYDDLITFVRQSTYSIDELFDIGKNYQTQSIRSSGSGGRTTKKAWTHITSDRKK
jgi:hypothetical protein